MQRRTFLGAGVAAAGLPLAAAADEGQRRGMVKVMDSYLTNAEQFPQAVWPAAGTHLVLRLEPLRSFDPQSILVLFADAPLGYLPPLSSRALSALMDQGVPAGAIAGTKGSLSVFIGTA